MHADRFLAVIAAAACAAAARPAAACGPEFPADLLSDRAATLLDLEDGVFLIEVADLVPPPARHPYVADEPADARARGGDAERRLYDAGAAAFRAGDRAGAAARFEALLALPAGERRHRSTWAAYMLGRARDRDDAIAAYRQVRALADAGFADDLGLAASSLGQEARLHLASGDPIAAIHLYAAQAATGHPDGGTSLLAIVRDHVAGAREAALLADPIGQRLVAIYVRTRGHELTADERARVWAGLVAAPDLAGADALAAAAYRAGDWDLAARLAARADTPLARRVRAKLALRAGDRATADRLLAGVHGQLADPDADARVVGERATLALAADEPREAMALLWAVRHAYPYDAAHVAERVLTVDELRAFVDGVAPPDGAVPDDHAYLELRQLRALLARRLMRAGRFGDARPYFAARERAIAGAYAGALARADALADPIERARARYDASRIARVHGLEILGAQVAPDHAIEGARFDLGAWGIAPAVDPSIGPVERARVAASAPWPHRRYHYRYTASALAARAADHLPGRSQAFAATLCHAARYVRQVDQARVSALWARYVADGPTVEFAATFGDACPEPAFDRARRYLPRARSRWPGRAAALGALAVAVAVAVLARRRRRLAIP